MANTHTTLTDLFADIAASIRIKKNSSEPIIADNFPTEISNLRTGFDYTNQQVTSISDYEFKNCEDLLSVDCCNLTSVGTSAFENCTNLKSVILYDSVASVGENAFKGCSEDLKICCMFKSQPDTWNENWNPDGLEVVWVLVETWDISATENDNVAAKLYRDINNTDNYSLTINGSGNMVNYEYQSNAWYDYRTNINSILISNGVENIGDRAFQECSSLKAINISNSVNNIGLRAFDGCVSLTSITMPNSVISIGTNAFSGCSKLTSITIPDSVTSIGASAFYNCSGLTSITMPNSVISIGTNAFYNCSGLTKVYITDVSNWCNITFSRSDGGTPLYYGAGLYLNGELLAEIAIPDNITAIIDYTFYRYKPLTTVTIPDSVTVISPTAFQYCINLTSIIYTGTVSQWKAITFKAGFTPWDYNTGNYTIHCTDGDIAKDGTITYHTTTTEVIDNG